MTSFKFFTALDIYDTNSSLFIGNPFTRLKPITVSRLSTELVDEEDYSVGKENLGLRNPIVEKNKRNIWKRFHGVKRESREPFFRKSGKEQVQEEKRSSFVCNGKLSVELENAVGNVGPESSVEQCNIILRQLEQCNDEKTLTFFEWMRSNGKLRENVSAYKFALRVLGRKEDWETAEMLLHELITDSGLALNFLLFNTLIYACYRRGLEKLGTKWFRLMLENAVKPNIATFGMLMSLYQKGGNVVEAEFAFHKMRSLKLKCQSAYSAMITIFTRLGLYDKSEEIIHFMKEDDMVPNSENWLVQINAYSQQGKLEDAERVLMSMQEAGVPPNIVAYNTMITGYGKASDMDSAERIFQRLQIFGLEPDETTYRTMVEGWGRANHLKNAKCYYQKLKHSGFAPNSSNMFTMINLQARCNDEEGTLETLEDMRRMGCQYSSILSSLLQAYEKVERVDKVPLVVRGSFYEHILVDQNSCSILVMAYVKHHLIDDALRILQDKQWKDLIFEDNLYHLLICSCKESGMHEEAIKIFIHMPKSNANPNLHITSTMIDIYSIIGRFEEAKDLYLKLISSGNNLDMVAYSIVVRMYVKAGHLEDACLVLDKMANQKDIVPDTFLFRDMLRIYQKCGLQENWQNFTLNY
ncbi:hypothetical protein IFM89_024684 [Coptis chinensis]|uniref:Pentatricopeptide repeat-containing protein n=1 Tax=Coptis chinensis TaxID=261450 RepID=A0A835M1K8_9MAGN|nr:hypothetical protein IFM89_024684 [Coptis chinensis]